MMTTDGSLTDSSLIDPSLTVGSVINGSRLQNSGALRQYLQMEQAGKVYMMELTATREVLPLVEQPLTSVPNALPWVMGLFNLRGEILVLVDLGEMLGEDPVLRTSSQSRIVVIEMKEGRTGLLSRFGLAVGHVGGVTSLTVDLITSPPDIEPRLASVVQGLYNWDQRLLIILDAAAVAELIRASSS